MKLQLGVKFINKFIKKRMTFLNVFIQLGILFRNVKFYPRVFVNVGFCHISVLLFWPLFIYQINLIDTTRHI